MAQKSQIPKFGDWEGEENYTVYFDKARKGKGGKMTNPNDPQQSGDILSDDTPIVRAPPIKTGFQPEIPVESKVQKPRHERRSSRDDGGLRQISHENFNRKANNDTYHHQQGDNGVSLGDTPKKGGRTSAAGSERSVEQSPMHPHYQAKVGGRGGGSGPGSARSSPSWEKKNSEGSHGLAPSTPGRSRLRAVTRGDETENVYSPLSSLMKSRSSQKSILRPSPSTGDAPTQTTKVSSKISAQPDKGAAVPKFGDWDESDPASADGFTHIFNKVREEKQGGAAKLPSMSNDSYSNGHNQVNYGDSAMCGCLSWCKK